jgi:acylphosphatase
MNSEASDPARIRRMVYFSGEVQGVGFRARTRRIARDFEVTGFVRNLDDGRVELVAEGTPGEVDKFQAAILDRMHSLIHEFRAVEALAQDNFTEFTIER